MPNLFTRLFGGGVAAPALDHKFSRAGALLALHTVGLSRFTPRDNVSLTRHGYERNPIVYRCVRMVAEAAGSIAWRAYIGRDEQPDHPALALLARPNPVDAGPDFLEALISNQLLFGNAYIEASLVDGAPRELYALRPDRMSVAPGRNGWPTAYEYMVMGDVIRYDIPPEGVAPILHLKLFHPLDDHYGFSPMRSAQTAIDVHNTASGWNKSLLDNAARPSGALIYTNPQGLSGEQFDRLKAELDENFSGERNAGRPLLLEGGLDWKPLSMSPKDMDFSEAKAAAAREIALAFGVPPLLLGLPGDNTRANFEEANRAFWRQTVIPLVARMQKSFAHWLQPAFGEFTLDYDIDRIDALASERVQEWTRVGAATFLTDDEKREAVGYGKAPRVRKEDFAAPESGDAVANPDSGGDGGSGAWQNQPRVPAGQAGGGEWTSGGGGGDDGASVQTIADNQGRSRYAVDLLDEEARGGHTVQEHVGKSDEYLLRRIDSGTIRGLFVDIVMKRVGSFPSLEAATKLVNSTLAQNIEVVDQIANGNIPGEFVTAEFGSPTGKEAFRATGNGKAYIRDTTGVGVYLVRDSSASNGFRVISAYPRNE